MSLDDFASAAGTLSSHSMVLIRQKGVSLTPEMHNYEALALHEACLDIGDIDPAIQVLDDLFSSSHAFSPIAMDFKVVG